MDGYPKRQTKRAELCGVRTVAPNIPIIATGGPTNEAIRATIAAGANAVTYTPPSARVMFSEIMDNYREESID